MFSTIATLPIIKGINAAFLSLVFCINLIFFDNDRLIKSITAAPIKEEVYIAERDLLMDIYAPSGNKPARSKMLVIHGATEFGKEDERLVRICELFARLGFKLYVPNVKELMQWNMATTGVDDIIFIYKKYLSGEDEIRKGMLSYSVGCAALFIAASDDEISSDVDYLISFGGYYDAKNVLLFMTTGLYKEEGRWKRYQQEKDINKIFLERNIYMIKEGERGIVHRIIEEGPKEDLMNKLSEETKSLISLMYNRNKDNFYKLYDKVAPSVKNVFENISPKNYLKKIKADCYIAHSVPDFVIPHTESALLVKDLGDNVKGYYRFRFFRHVERKFQEVSFRKIFSEYIPDSVKFYIFIYKLLML